MNRVDILESVYEIIKNSTEWGIECQDGSYGRYVYGVITMADEMLEKEEEKYEAMTEAFKNMTRIKRRI